MLFVSLDKLHLPLDVLDSIDGIELRIDLFETLSFPSLSSFIKSSPKPILLTLRSRSQGGKCEDNKREDLLLKLLELKPHFCDLEYGMRKEFLENVLDSHPDTKFILSYHSFERSLDVKQLYNSMQGYKSHFYKIAKKVFSTIEALELMLFSKAHANLSVICMGDEGSFTRALSPAIGNPLNFAPLDEKSKTAEGQLSVFELIDTYKYPKLNEETKLYGLIGDPVEKSIGHVHHNSVFEKKNKNAVYVKMRVEKQDLSSFFPLAQAMGFKGMSVTMPLKEDTYEYLNSSSEIKAINTLLFKEKEILSINTDGKGAIKAVETRTLLRGKILVILGAGGSSKAIAFEAQKKGAHVWIINRTREKALSLSLELKCQGGGFEEIPEQYDVLINTIPTFENIDLSGVNPSTLVMDIVYRPKETSFLKMALEKGAEIIYGEEMFFNQAALQTTFWES